MKENASCISPTVCGSFFNIILLVDFISCFQDIPTMNSNISKGFLLFMSLKCFETPGHPSTLDLVCWSMSCLQEVME